MRVVSGKYRGKRFNPPRNFPSRPTTDFAKEALFNILNNRFDFEEIRVLDLFAGTGNISLEFLSRGVLHVLSVDNHAVSVRFLNEMKRDLNETNWQIWREDAFEYLYKTTEKFDLIFADPPYSLPNQDGLIDLIFTRNLLTQEGLFILEHGRENNFENKTHFKEIRNYGGVQFSFFEI